MATEKSPRSSRCGGEGLRRDDANEVDDDGNDEVGKK